MPKLADAFPESAADFGQLPRAEQEKCKQQDQK
jgi:hypothetical protein